MILPALFWWGLPLFYLGLGVVLIDLCLERDLSIVVRAIGGTIIVFVVALFTFGLVLFPAPLQVTSFWSKDGTDVSGVTWDSDESALIVYIKNPSNRDYADLDIALISNEAVAKAVEGTNVPCEQISANEMSISGTGWKDWIEWGPQRFRCDKLPKDTTIKFVLVLKNADPILHKLEHHKLGDPTHESLPANGLYGPKRKPSFFGVVATYSVTGRPHSMKTKIDIGNG